LQPLLVSLRCYHYIAITHLPSTGPGKPLTGSLALNEKLSGISKIYEDKLKGPEALLYYNNTLYTSVHYGHVLRLVNGQIIPLVKFGKFCDGIHEEHKCGRPLGLNVDKNGFLFVADSYYGIYKVNLNNPSQYEQIVSMDEVIDGACPNLPNSVVVSSDGTVYWTDSSINYKLYNGFYTDFVDGTGRLLKYDPKTKKNTVLMKNIMFANGVELSEDESFILISETHKYRILKYNLKGPNAGKSEIFIDGLPGKPDNIKRIGKNFYAPLVFSKVPIMEYISENPTIRMIIVKFLAIIDLTFETIDSFYPNIYCKKAAHWVGHYESISTLISFMPQRIFILTINKDGTIISSWQTSERKVSHISDIEVVGDTLYLGSPFNAYLGTIKVPRGFL